MRIVPIRGVVEPRPEFPDGAENGPVEIPDGFPRPAETAEYRPFLIRFDDNELGNRGNLGQPFLLPTRVDHQEKAYTVGSVQRCNLRMERSVSVELQTTFHPSPEFVQERILVAQFAQRSRVSFRSDPERQSAAGRWTEQEHGIVDVSVFGQVRDTG